MMLSALTRKGITRRPPWSGPPLNDGPKSVAQPPPKVISVINRRVGTYILNAGLTDEIYRKGFIGSVNAAFGANIWIDDNITVDTNDDAEGFVFAQEGIILVDGMGLRKEAKRRPEYGGGADQIWMTMEYVFAERSPGNWLYSFVTDALAPTS